MVPWPEILSFPQLVWGVFPLPAVFSLFQALAINCYKFTSSPPEQEAALCCEWPIDLKTQEISVLHWIWELVGTPSVFHEKSDTHAARKDKHYPPPPFLRLSFVFVSLCLPEPLGQIDWNSYKGGKIVKADRPVIGGASWTDKSNC
eukprot:676004-Pelagomonas_calceolata.AAC.1